MAFNLCVFLGILFLSCRWSTIALWTLWLFSSPWRSHRQHRSQPVLSSALCCSPLGGNHQFGKCCLKLTTLFSNSCGDINHSRLGGTVSFHSNHLSGVLWHQSCDPSLFVTCSHEVVFIGLKLHPGPCFAFQKSVFSQKLRVLRENSWRIPDNIMA